MFFLAGRKGEKRGRRREAGGRRREKKGQQAGFPRWQEVREKRKNNAIYGNKKNAKEVGTGQEPGLKGAGGGRFKTPCPPHM